MDRPGWLVTTFRDHGLLVGLACGLFVWLRRATAWELFHRAMGRTGHPFWGGEPSTGKRPAFVQDAAVIVGVLMTWWSVATVIRHPVGSGIYYGALVVGGWHFFGLLVYHVNVLFFDDLVSVEPRVASFRRLFFQSVVSLGETVVFFAALYQLYGTAPEFRVGLRWSIQAGLTFNVPVEWNNAFKEWQGGIWLSQIVVSVFFLLILLATLAPQVFKRKEIAPDPAPVDQAIDALNPAGGEPQIHLSEDGRERGRIKAFWVNVEQCLKWWAEHSLARQCRLINREGWYLVGALIALLCLLRAGSSDIQAIQLVAAFLAVVYVADALVVNTSIAFVTSAPIHRLRSMVLTLLNLVNLAVAFSVFYVAERGCFGKGDVRGVSLEPLEALYFSFVTIATLGYGDISPGGVCASRARLTVISELIVGVYFVTVIVAVVASWTRRPADESPFHREPSAD